MRGILGQQHRRDMKEARKLVKNSSLAMHIGSVALAVEALETILVEKGLLKDDELMQKIQSLSQDYSKRGVDLPAQRQIPSGDD